MVYLSGGSMSIFSFFLISVSSRPQSGKSDVQMQSCVKCDKMFTTKCDLDIHKAYCFGGI